MRLSDRACYESVQEYPQVRIGSGDGDSLIVGYISPEGSTIAQVVGKHEPRVRASRRNPIRDTAWGFGCLRGHYVSISTVGTWERPHGAGLNYIVIIKNEVNEAALDHQLLIFGSLHNVWHRADPVDKTFLSQWECTLLPHAGFVAALVLGIPEEDKVVSRGDCRSDGSANAIPDHVLPHIGECSHADTLYVKFARVACGRDAWRELLTESPTEKVWCVSAFKWSLHFLNPPSRIQPAIQDNLWSSLWLVLDSFEF